MKTRARLEDERLVGRTEQILLVFTGAMKEPLMALSWGKQEGVQRHAATRCRTHARAGLLALVCLATVSATRDVHAGGDVYLGFYATGGKPVHLRVYAWSRSPPTDTQRPALLATLRPGESVTLPFVGNCYLWQRTFGLSSIDWSPLQFACTPDRRLTAGKPRPYVAWVALQN